MKTYTVVYEQAGQNWCAYSPDVPGCIATAPTRNDIEREFRDALEFHIEGMQMHGEAVPEPTTDVGRVTVQTAFTPEMASA